MDGDDFMARSAGILMPITSLPSPYGIGTIGKAAYDFVDFLKYSGQKYWQILPVGPTSYGDSPYQSFSTYAGNPYLIDLDFLCEENLLIRDEITALDWGEDEEKIDYAKTYNNRFKVLKIAYDRFMALDDKEKWDFWKFCDKNDSWLGNYALYMSVKNYFGNKAWTEWPDKLIRHRNPDTINYYNKLLGYDVGFFFFFQ